MSYMEEALARTGWGLYSKFLVGFAAASFLTNGLAYMSTPLYLPLIVCDVAIQDSVVLAIDMALPLGAAFGGFIFCAISDVAGRNSILTFTLVLTFTSILSASFAYSGVGLVITQILLGSGITGNTNTIRILLSESLSMEKRGKSVMLLDIFWNLGCVFATLLYLLFMPIILKFKSHYVRVFTWRLLYGFSSILIIWMACLTSLVLQSPRFLIYERRVAEALNVLRQIFAINNSRIASNYMITETDLQGKIADYGINAERDIPNTLTTKRCMIITRRIHKSLMTLVRKKFFGMLIVVVLIRALTCFGWLMLSIFLTKSLFYDGETYNFTIDSLNILHFDHPVYTDCNNITLNVDVYRDFLVLTCMSIFGQVLGIFSLDYIERRYLIFSGFLVSGLISLGLAFIYNNYIVRFILSASLLMSYSSAESCLNLIILEIFPTAVRGTAYAETYVFSKILDAFLLYYLEATCFWTFVAIAILLNLSALLSLFFPYFKDRPMVD